jgi:hypothetical protein
MKFKTAKTTWPFEARIFQLLAEYAHFRTVSRNFCFGHGNDGDRQNAGHRQRRRRDIFVETRTNKIRKPRRGGVFRRCRSYGALFILESQSYKDASPTGFSRKGESFWDYAQNKP